MGSMTGPRTEADLLEIIRKQAEQKDINNGESIVTLLHGLPPCARLDSGEICGRIVVKMLSGLSGLLVRNSVSRT